jgi:SHAQKYF class myb-like DNA-binding protein
MNITMQLPIRIMPPIERSATSFDNSKQSDKHSLELNNNVDAQTDKSSIRKNRKRKPVKTTGSTTTTRCGRWSDDEHQAFLLGVSRYGRHWKRIAQVVHTRTPNQVRSHAQKCFAKITSHCTTAASLEVSSSSSLSVRLRVERIMADPEAAAVEVHETLQRLKKRYRELQNKEQQTNNHRQSGKMRW